LVVIFDRPCTPLALGMRALLLLSLPSVFNAGAVGAYVSISGDPFYAAADPAVLLSAWNFCNEALAPPQMP
jgi:hypothetical protein